MVVVEVVSIIKLSIPETSFLQEQNNTALTNIKENNGSAFFVKCSLVDIIQTYLKHYRPVHTGRVVEI